MNHKEIPMWLRLGASMYVPSTHTDLLEIASGEKYPSLRSVIFCTEDSILEKDVQDGLKNIEKTLTDLTVMKEDLLCFVRVRNMEVLKQVLLLNGIEKLAGIVVPKVTAGNVREYLEAIHATTWKVMLTLETAETFERSDNEKIKEIISLPEFKERVLTLRIGGNDLLNVLNLRRPRNRTAYESPLRPLIDQLVLMFRPAGFNLSAPVYEHMDEPAILSLEAEEDLVHGLFGKTVIHPNQIATVEAQYKVSHADVDVANAILDVNAPAVFKMNGSMCEPATHRNWARLIKGRAELYGLHDAA